MTDINLKPCPFCAAASETQSDFGREWWVQCTDDTCGSTDGKLYDTPAKAEAAWNRRPAASLAGLPAPLPVCADCGGTKFEPFYRGDRQIGVVCVKCDTVSGCFGHQDGTALSLRATSEAIPVDLAAPSLQEHATLNESGSQLPMPVETFVPITKLIEPGVYAVADKYGARYRTADEEGMTFDKHALLEFANELQTVAYGEGRRDEALEHGEPKP